MFCNLEGVRGDLDGPFSPKKVAPFMALLKDNRLVSAVGGSGCLVVYTDDVGNLRGNFSRNFYTLSKKIFKTKKEVAEWLAEWLPELSCDIVYVRKNGRKRK